MPLDTMAGTKFSDEKKKGGVRIRRHSGGAERKEVGWGFESTRTEGSSTKKRAWPKLNRQAEGEAVPGRSICPAKKKSY